MEETEFLRLLFVILIGGAGLIVTLVGSGIAVYKFVQKEIEKKLAKHFKHEHLLKENVTIRDRLVECNRVCPVNNPTLPPASSAPATGGSDDTRGHYSKVRRSR